MCTATVSSTFAISFRIKRAAIVPERPSLWKSTWYHSPSLTFLSMALVLVVPEPMSSSKYRCPSSISIAKKSTCRWTGDRCKKKQTGTFVQAVKMQIIVAGVQCNLFNLLLFEFSLMNYSSWICRSGDFRLFKISILQLKLRISVTIIKSLPC